jgi:hypothetical protein
MEGDPDGSALGEVDTEGDSLAVTEGDELMLGFVLGFTEGADEIEG